MPSLAPTPNPTATRIHDNRYLKTLKQNSHAFILVAKPRDHKALFEDFNSLQKPSYKVEEKKIIHRFEWANGLAINDRHEDCLVNVLEYWEEHANGKRGRCVWVIKFELNENNVYQVMRVGRARHRIENETFNTLKIRGGNLSIILDMEKSTLVWYSPI